MKLSLKSISLLCALAPSLVLAGGINGFINFPTARVLPKGVRNFQYNGIFAQGNTKFDGSGDVVPLGEAFDATITYQDLVNSEETLQDQVFAEAKINENPDISLTDKMGVTNGMVNIGATVHAPVFAYGVNEKWTVGMIVPIIESDVNVDVGSVADESLQQVADYFAQPGQSMRSKLETVRSKFINAVNNEIADKGYDPLEDEQDTQLGDIQLISRYNFYKDQKWQITALNNLVLPTGTKSDVDKLITVGSGDEQWDIGAGLIADYKVNAQLTLTAMTNYTVQLEHQTEHRIYEKADYKITPLVDENVTRDLGDIFQLAFAGHYSFLDNFTARALYSYQYKEEDVYTGTKFAAENYSFMSAETEQELQTVQLGISFDTISMYKRNEFAAPMALNLNLIQPIAGRNTINDTMFTTSMSLFF